MLLDAVKLAPETVLEDDVAVVGAGPAGIVLALELARAGRRVTLVESGGSSFDPATQALGEIADGDPLHAPMSLATRRQVGGASNLWAGRCVPFDPVDFQPRAITGYARWPVSYEELRPYFARACQWLACGRKATFDAEEIPGLADASLIPGWPGSDIRATALERWSSPTSLRRRYGRELAGSERLTVAQRLTCTEIACGRDGSSVTHLACRTLAGTSVLVKARCYILACGGVESTRLLMVSDRGHTGGIGNHSSHLGRWYMAHVESRIADVHFVTPPRETIFDFERDPDGVYIRRRFTFEPEFMVAHRLPNAALLLANPELGDSRHGSGTLSFLYLVLASPLGPLLISEAIRLKQLETTRRGSCASHLANVLRELLATSRFAASFGYRRFATPGRKVPGVCAYSRSNVYPLVFHGEHLPHYGSHLSPTSARDALGVPRLRARLCFTDEDVEGVVDSHRHFDEYLRRHRLGRLEYLYSDPRPAIRGQLFGGYHQAGTTRMAKEPEDGVLDGDLAVHGIDNLYVASSSSFVTASQANTTFMIVVFALRLADRLIALERG